MRWRVTSWNIVCMGMSPFAVTGCAKDDKNTVAKDSEWYSTVRFDATDHYKTGDKPVDSIQASYAGIDEDKIYFVCEGMYEIPDDVDVMKVRTEDYEFTFLDVFDLEGNLLTVSNPPQWDNEDM